jgi:hypothetical protein
VGAESVQTKWRGKKAVAFTRNQTLSIWSLPVKSQYIYSLMMFVIKNRDKFVRNDIHELKNKQNMNLHMHQVHLAKYSKGV